MMRWTGVLALISACSLSLGLGIFLGRGSNLRAPAAAALKQGSSSPSFENSEIKLELAPSELKPLLSLLDITEEGLTPKRRSITFFDSKDLTLHREGIVLRARVKPDGDGETTIKILDMRGDTQVDRGKDFKCEWDRGVEGGSASRNCSFSDDRGALEFAHVLVMKDRPLKTLFSKSQLQFFEDAATPRGLPHATWDLLQPMGPVHSSSWKVPAPFARRLELTVELWEIPGVNRILEVSVRTPVDEADDAAGRLEDWVRRNQLQVIHSKSSKTEWLLKHFAGQVRR